MRFSRKEEVTTCCPYMPGLTGHSFCTSHTFSDRTGEGEKQDSERQDETGLITCYARDLLWRYAGPGMASPRAARHSYKSRVLSIPLPHSTHSNAGGRRKRYRRRYAPTPDLMAWCLAFVLCGNAFTGRVCYHAAVNIWLRMDNEEGRNTTLLPCLLRTTALRGALLHLYLQRCRCPPPPPAAPACRKATCLPACLPCACLRPAPACLPAGHRLPSPYTHLLYRTGGVNIPAPGAIQAAAYVPPNGRGTNTTCARFHRRA